MADTTIPYGFNVNNPLEWLIPQTNQPLINVQTPQRVQNQLDDQYQTQIPQTDRRTTVQNQTNTPVDNGNTTRANLVSLTNGRGLSRYTPSPRLADVNETTSIRRGHSGNDVQYAQAWLNRRGANPPLAEDGKFGPKTQAAVRAFQQRNNIQENGIGPKTLEALKAEDRKELADDASFAKLTPEVQADVQQRLAAQVKRASDGPDAIGGRDQLMGLATQDGFEQLKPEVQRQMLEIQGKKPADGSLTGPLMQLSGSAPFRGLPVAEQQAVLSTVDRVMGNPEALNAVDHLARSAGFAALSADERKSLLEVLSTPGHQAQKALIDAVSVETYDAMNGEQQKGVLAAQLQRLRALQALDQ